MEDVRTKRSTNPDAESILGLYFPVLDHGFVCLKDYMGSDADVVEAARVSYGAGTKKESSPRQLVRYLLSHRHTSPFEQVELKFHVGLPIFVARQLVRHRTASINEYSLRYSLPVMKFYVPDPEVMGTQSKKNKQGRSEAVPLEKAQEIRGRWLDLNKRAEELYGLITADDIDLTRELARLHLPLSIYTTWIWKIDLHNCLHFLKLRVDKHAQWEIQQTARLKAAIVKCVAPISFEAWIDYNYQARTFSRMEMQLLQSMLREDGLDRSLDLDTDPHVRYGMTKNEMAAFRADLFDTSYEPEQFELDLTKAKTAEWYAEELKRYLPATA